MQVVLTAVAPWIKLLGNRCGDTTLSPSMMETCSKRAISTPYSVVSPPLIFGARVGVGMSGRLTLDLV